MAASAPDWRWRQRDAMDEPKTPHEQLAAAPHGLWLAFRGAELLLTEAAALPAGDALAALGSAPLRIQSLAPHSPWDWAACERGALPCFCAELASDAEPPPGTRFTHLKRLNDHLPDALRSLAARALELIEWDRAHRFCGACGSPTMQAGEAKVRTCTNPECRREHYPRVSPVVIVAVERGDEILLGRSPHFAPGFYSTLAGFVDAGETAEEAVHREIFEEVALRVRNLRYVASQPWPFPHSLMLGFHADYDSGDIVCAEDEIEHAAFFHVDDLPASLPGRSTIAHWLLRDFCLRRGRQWPAQQSAG